MKILWFANTPCGATELNPTEFHGGGWLVSLENQLKEKPDVQLGVCFYTNNIQDSFQYKGVNYFPIQRKLPNNKFSRLIKRWFNNNINDEKEIQQLLNIVSTFKPDLIHIHGTEDNFGLIQKYTTVPVIISIQGILNPYTEKYFAGISYNNVKKYTSFKTFFLKNSYLDRFYDFKKRAQRELEIFKNTKNVIGRTDWDRQVTRSLAPNSSYFINNEIMRAGFYSKNWKKSTFNKEVKLVTTTSNGLYKGYETVVKTAAILKMNTNFLFQWIVIGLSEQDELVRLVEKSLKINSNHVSIKLVGNKNEVELINELMNSDIYCQVSHIENSPNSVCEAMMLGMPIIASNVGGTNSIINHKSEGILIQDGDPYTLAGAIIELTMNFNMARELGQKAKEKAHIRHNPNQIVDDLCSIYKSIINS